MKKTYHELPGDYEVCKHSDCPMANTCLHQIAYSRLIETQEYLRLINPRRCTYDSTCKYYRSNTPVMYARGFTNFQQQMFPGQYAAFMSKLIACFGRNPYFERRRGDYPLPPQEQRLILETLQESGVKQDLKFDSYEELTNWYD